jgi:hypothetical protein
MNRWIRREGRGKWHRLLSERTYCGKVMKPPLLEASVPPGIDVHRLEVCQVCRVTLFRSVSSRDTPTGHP